MCTGVTGLGGLYAQTLVVVELVLVLEHAFLKPMIFTGVSTDVCRQAKKRKIVMVMCSQVRLIFIIDITDCLITNDRFQYLLRRCWLCKHQLLSCFLECPDGYEVQCFYGSCSCYRFNYNSLSWDDARKECKKIGSNELKEDLRLSSYLNDSNLLN